MHKRILALAVLAALAGAAAAQSNVTVYGVVDAGVSYKNDGNPAGNTWGIESGQQSGSRIGFKGREALGAGMFATFALENGFNADTGTFAQSDSSTSRLFGRQAWVGLEGDFGKVRLGRQQTELYYALDAVDPFHIGLAGNAQRVFGYGTYGSDPLAHSGNTISYTSPTINGFTASASYGFGETAGDTSAKRNVGLGYTSYSYLKNEDGVALATYNDGVYSADVKLFNAGMRHMF